MVRFVTPDELDPLMAIWSSPTLIVLQAMVPLLADSPGVDAVGVVRVAVREGGAGAVGRLRRRLDGDAPDHEARRESLTWNLGEF